MKFENGHIYPNNKTKSFLYETHFHHYDFLCTPEAYAEEIELVRIQESNGREICSWFEDVDGKLIVAGLRLENPYLRIEITPNGFGKINAATKKCLAAKNNKVRHANDVKRLFSPGRAIDNPLMFVGRHEQVRRILETDLDHGRLFMIYGERSTGKTSLAQILTHYFNGNTDIAEYYEISTGDEINDFYPIFIDISSGIYNCEQLSQEILSKMDPKNSSDINVINKFSLCAAGFAKYERSYSKGAESKTAEQRLSNLFETLSENGKKIALVIDEFDLFEDAEGFAKTLRYWTSHGLICFVVGTGERFNKLIKGHLSLARNAVPVELSPLPKDEFKEIFYLASTIAESVIRFDESAIDLMYDASAGLPYFGQLFGSMHIDMIKGGFGSLDEFYELVKKNGEYTIYRDNVLSMLDSIGEYCMQFERETQEIIKHIPNGADSVLSLALNEYSLLNNSGNNSTEWLENSELVRSLIAIDDGHMRIVDPVLRQYIVISRRNWSNE